MIKRATLIFALLAAVSLAFAEPFVWPSDWSAAQPADAVSGGTLRSYETGELRTFNPFVSSESTNATDFLMNDMFAGARLIVQGPTSDEWLPYAAESYEVSEDGTVVDVVLRDGIKWSDGTPVTVQDYYFRWVAETDADVGSNAYDSWFIDDEPITVEITGDNSLRFTFPAPDRDAFPVVAMVPAPDHILGKIYRDGGAEALKAAWGTDVDPKTTVWTNPWIPTGYSAERITFSRNPYFGEWNQDEAGNPLPYLDTVQFSVVESTDAALNLFLAGQLDLYSPRNLDDIGVINNAINNGAIDATVLESASPVASSQFIVFNWNKASDPFKQDLFRSAIFRQAMSHLVPRDAIIELVYGGAASPMWSPVYQVLDFWVNNDVPKYPYDPERATALLSSLGFTEKNGDGVLVDDQGNALEFTLATNSGNPQREQIAQIFADAAGEVGVQVNVELLDFNLLVEQLLTTGDDRPFDAILIGLTGGSRTWPFGSNVIPCGTNLHMYNQASDCLTPEEILMTRLYFEGRKTLDTDAAREIGNRLQEVQAQIQPQIYTVSPDAHYAWLTGVSGEHPSDFINAIVGSRELVLTFKQQ